MHCIYCNKEQPSSSLEHIIPRALGGNLANDLFKTRRVCKNCNNWMGLFVDALYVKSYFTLANFAKKISFSLDNPKIKTLPLYYFGHMKDLDAKLGFDYCELWISPCRSRIFHFHNNSEERYFTYAGGNPINRKKSGGLAVFCNTSENEQEIQCGVRSFVESFKSADRVIWGIETPEPIPEEIARKPNEAELSWIQWYRQQYEIEGKGGHPMNFSIEQGYPDRLMGKIALGLGFNLFGDAFLNSEYSHQLRDYLWEKYFDKRQHMNVPRINNFGNPAGSTLGKVNLPEDKITIILFMIHPIGLVLDMNIFGDEQSIVITAEESLCQQFNSEYPQGVVYTLDPIYQVSEGPINLMKYIAKSHAKLIEK